MVTEDKGQACSDRKRTNSRSDYEKWRRTLRTDQEGDFLMNSVSWYQMEISDVFAACKTRLKGLTRQEAEDRLKQYGPNSMPGEKGINRLAIIVHQFTSPLIYILLVSAVITALLKGVHRYRGYFGYSDN